MSALSRFETGSASYRNSSQRPEHHPSAYKSPIATECPIRTSTSRHSLGCKSSHHIAQRLRWWPAFRRRNFHKPQWRRPNADRRQNASGRSEEHTSELQSLMRISYAVFCLKKKKNIDIQCTNNKTYTKQTYKYQIQQTHA